MFNLKAEQNANSNKTLSVKVIKFSLNSNLWFDVWGTSVKTEFLLFAVNELGRFLNDC